MHTHTEKISHEKNYRNRIQEKVNLSPLKEIKHKLKISEYSKKVVIRFEKEPMILYRNGYNI